jgi:predicted amidohydrolase
MTQMAKHKNAAVCGSILFQEDKFYNRFLFVEPDGRLSTYDKHHLFSLVGEQHLLSKGDKKIIISYRGWEIQPFICYDLRFPAWCLNDSHADIQLFVASWPSKRIHHWSILLKARAIENQCYTLGVNRVGTDFFSHEHNGHSAAYDMAGNELCNMSDSIGVQIVKLSKENLEKHKKHYPFWKDRDTFALPLE